MRASLAALCAGAACSPTPVIAHSRLMMEAEEENCAFSVCVCVCVCVCSCMPTPPPEILRQGKKINCMSACNTFCTQVGQISSHQSVFSLCSLHVHCHMFQHSYILKKPQPRR